MPNPHRPDLTATSRCVRGSVALSPPSPGEAGAQRGAVTCQMSQGGHVVEIRPEQQEIYSKGYTSFLSVSRISISISDTQITQLPSVQLFYWVTFHN